MVNLVNLDECTRKYMLEEVNADAAANRLYVSSRLTDKGRASYLDLLRQAVTHHDSGWLATQLQQCGYLRTTEPRRHSRDRCIQVTVPVTAAATLAEAEFGHDHARGVCRRAKDENREVKVYRAKQVADPRLRSEARIDEVVNAEQLLEHLRRHSGIETTLGLLGGPGSGINICLV